MSAAAAAPHLKWLAFHGKPKAFRSVLRQSRQLPPLAGHSIGGRFVDPPMALLTLPRGLVRNEILQDCRFDGSVVAG